MQNLHSHRLARVNQLMIKMFQQRIWNDLGKGLSYVVLNFQVSSSGDI